MGYVCLLLCAASHPPYLSSTTPLLDRSWLEKQLGLNFPWTITVGTELAQPWLRLIFLAYSYFPKASRNFTWTWAVSWYVQHMRSSLFLWWDKGRQEVCFTLAASPTDFWILVKYGFCFIYQGFSPCSLGWWRAWTWVWALGQWINKASNVQLVLHASGVLLLNQVLSQNPTMKLGDLRNLA